MQGEYPESSIRYLNGMKHLFTLRLLETILLKDVVERKFKISLKEETFLMKKN